LRLISCTGEFVGKKESQKMASDEPVVRMAEIEIDPAHLEAYLRLLAEEIEASVSLETGVLALNAVAIKGSPEKIRILEVYANRAAYEAHLQTPHFLKYKEGAAGMVTSLTLIEVEPVMMRSKP
jgi:quinol monooxygenase YgiN